MSSTLGTEDQDLDPGTYRLRSQNRAPSNKQEPRHMQHSEKSSKKGKGAGKEKPINMEELLVHLNEAQQKTEQSLMEAIVLSKKELKADMEGMTTTLRESVDNIRSDLNRIEDSFGSNVKQNKSGRK